MNFTVSDNNIFLKAYTIEDKVKLVTPARWLFSPQGQNLKNLCREPLDEATCQIMKAMGFLVLREMSFYGCPNISLCQTGEPRYGPNFDTRGII